MRQLGRDIALVGPWRNGGTPPCSFHLWKPLPKQEETPKL